MPVYLHLFMIGWVTQMIFGVAYWMFPRVSKENPRGWDTQDVLGSLEELLRLAQRLQRAATVKDYAPKPSATS
jgi:hypothetical protein